MSKKHHKHHKQHKEYLETPSDFGYGVHDREELDKAQRAADTEASPDDEQAFLDDIQKVAGPPSSPAASADSTTPAPDAGKTAANTRRLDATQLPRLDEDGEYHPVADAEAASVKDEENPFKRQPVYSQDHTEMMRVRKRRKSKRKKHRALKVVVIIVAVLMVIGAGVAFATQIGKQNLFAKATDVSAPEQAVSYSEGKTIEYNGHTYQYNDNIVSLCFMGFDKKAIPEDPELHGQADAVIVATLDTTNGAVKLISIPRDSMVDVGVYTDDGTYLRTEKRQICLAFGYGDGGAVSCKDVMDTASRTLYNMPINYYYALDENGVGALADAIDGVPLTALQSIPGTNITEGRNVILYGNNALNYVQYRDTSYLTSSLDRQERQIQFVRAFMSKTLSNAKGNVGSLVKLYQTAGDYSMTNLGASEFLYLASNVTSNGVTDVSMTSLKGTMTQGAVYAEYNLDPDSVYQTVLDTYYTQIS